LDSQQRIVLGGTVADAAADDSHYFFGVRLLSDAIFFDGFQ
jgi:hypothetical protein